MIDLIRNRGRVVECSGLESRKPWIGFVGSNPTGSSWIIRRNRVDDGTVAVRFRLSTE